MSKVVIIGAGVAGLAVAATCASRGRKVAVYEKNSTAGGKLGTLDSDGYTWDTGPSLFTQPYLLESLFTACGKHLQDYLQYEPLDITTRYFYEDGTSIIAYKNLNQFTNEISLQLNIGSNDVLVFAEEVKKMYNNIGSIFLNKKIHNFQTWVSPTVVKALRSLKPDYLFSTMHEYHVRRLKHPKLVQLFDRFATYNGSDPYKAPAMLCMIAHLELNEGAYYPTGGMISITNALYKLCTNLGVQFQFNESVQKIITTEAKVSGVLVNNEIIEADVVVSNSDVFFTYKNLLNNQQIARKLQQQERSSSAIIFYWGINKKFNQLGLHNILFSNQYEAEFNAIFDKHKLFTDPTIYINITSKMDAAHAPDGCENWFVLVNTPDARYINKDSVSTVREYIIAKIKRMLGEDIAQNIVSEHVLTPEIIEQQTGSYLGALYGTASNKKMAAFVRHSNVSSFYHNLFFAGGTVHPGGGIPLCLRSANIASESIEKYYLAR